MSLEMTMLQMLSKRDTWSKLRGAVPRSGLDDRTKQLATRINEYYRAFPDVQEVATDPFLTWYFGTVKTNADDEIKMYWRTVLDRMQEPLESSLEAGMYGKLLELGTGTKFQDILNRYVEGEDVDLIGEISGAIDIHRQNSRAREVDPIVDSNVLDLMDASENHEGIVWRLPIFNDHMRPMAGGDFIGVAARPDNGKTSFLTDNLSFIAPQLEGFFGENRPAAWFCNEGAARKIWMRVYQSVMNMTMTELGEFRRGACKGNDTKFLDAIFEKLGGRGTLHIIDANKMSNMDIEDMVAKLNPGVVVYDMIDNVHFAGLTSHGGTRTDQVLESMYKWARELCVATDHLGFATSQISGEGEGLAFPSKAMLKDSKTGKQGTFDVQLMIGASNSNGMEDMRYFSTPKNKLKVDGSPSCMKAECTFDSSRGRFNAARSSSYVEQDKQEEVPPAGVIANDRPIKAAKPIHDPLGD